MDKKIKLTFSDWDYTCGDGCCYEWGTTIKVNKGEELTIHFADANSSATAVVEVLTHLGYEVDFDFGGED